MAASLICTGGACFGGFSIPEELGVVVGRGAFIGALQDCVKDGSTDHVVTPGHADGFDLAPHDPSVDLFCRASPGSLRVCWQFEVLDDLTCPHQGVAGFRGHAYLPYHVAVTGVTV